MFQQTMQAENPFVRQRTAAPTAQAIDSGNGLYAENGCAAESTVPIDGGPTLELIRFRELRENGVDLRGINRKHLAYCLQFRTAGNGTASSPLAAARGDCTTRMRLSRFEEAFRASLLTRLNPGLYNK